jgi:hypothetical protein
MQTTTNGGVRSQIGPGTMKNLKELGIEVLEQSPDCHILRIRTWEKSVCQALALLFFSIFLPLVYYYILAYGVLEMFILWLSSLLFFVLMVILPLYDYWCNPYDIEISDGCMEIFKLNKVLFFSLPRRRVEYLSNLHTVRANSRILFSYNRWIEFKYVDGETWKICLNYNRERKLLEIACILNRWIKEERAAQGDGLHANDVS